MDHKIQRMVNNLTAADQPLIAALVNRTIPLKSFTVYREDIILPCIIP